MGIETDLNISPYFDDFDREKDFHQVLYNSGVVLQARELTQAQSIIHDKIEQLGKFNLREGSVLEGCDFSYDPNVRFLRIRDTQVLPATDGSVSSSRGLDVDVAALTPGMLLSGETSGAVAEVVDSADGYETDPTDTKTVFFKYIGKRTAFGSAAPEFESGENILAVAKRDTLLANAVVGTGSSGSSSGGGYSAGNVIEVGGATVSITTVSSGSVTAATAAPTDSPVSVESVLLSASSVDVSSTDNTAVVPTSEARLNFNFENSIRITAITGTTAKPTTGYAYQFAIEDGYIWQKGTSLRVDEQNVIVEKYTNTPDGKSVVFNVEEEIVTSATDETLLDNAHGFNNENAPGADRLKLTPRLAVADSGSISSTHTKLVEFRDGKPVRINNVARLGTIGDIIARRADETHGDYVVDPFHIVSQTDDSTIANGYGELSVAVSGGTAYVKGYRQEFHATTRVPVDRGFGNTANAASQAISISFDNYIGVENTRGIPLTGNGKVYFTDGTDTLAPSQSPVHTLVPGDSRILGETWIRGYEHNNDTDGTFDAYLTGSPPEAARKVVATNASNEVVFAGDIVLREEERGGNTTNVIARSSSTDIAAIYPLGRKAAKNVSSITAVHYETNDSATVSGGSITLDDLSSERESFVLSFRSAAGSYSAGDVLHHRSDGVSFSGETVSITGLTAANVSVSYARERTATARTKTAYRGTVTYKGSVANGEDILTLGVPDAYEIVSITENGTDRMEDFMLLTGQTDTHYGTSYICRTKGSAINIGNTQDFIIEFMHFSHGAASSDMSLFTINSYGSTLIEHIPFYTSKAGVRYDLRDCADFRPSVAPTAANATANNWTETFASAAVVNGFSSGIDHHVVPGAEFEFDIENYLGRIDFLEVSQNGIIGIKEGEPSTTPAPPNSSNDAMVIAFIDVPPFPALDTVYAQEVERVDLGVRLVDQQKQRLTQASLNGMRERVRSLEYYAALNLLEKDTSDLVIRSEIDPSLDRFKHGIFVDNFENLVIGDFRDPEFKASIDPSRKLLQPRFRSYDIKLDVDAAASTGDSYGTNGLWAKSHPTVEEEAVVSQTQATTSRVCAGSVYNYRGEVSLTPNYDNGPDVTRGPVKSINVDIDTASPALALLDEINTILVDQHTDVDVARTQDRQVTRETESRGSSVVRRVHTDITTTTTTTRRTQQLSGRTETETNTQRVGDFVTDVSFRRYIRAQNVEFRASGLMPNVRHWIFFDGEDVTSRCRRETGGSFVDGMVSSADGNLDGRFHLPGGRFFVGDRNFVVLSEPSLDNRVEAISAAAGRFSAYNFSARRSGLDLNLNTRSLDVDTREIVDTETMKTYRRLTSVSSQSLGLSLTPRRAGKITANWNRIREATSYTISRSAANGTTEDTSTRATITRNRTTSYTFDGLTEGASYTVFLVADIP